jgi:hypothetical protein
MEETPVPHPEPQRTNSPEGPRRSSRFLYEAIVILGSVTLGFAASEFGQYRDERGLARSVLQGVRDEVEQNEATLTTLLAKHREWEKAIAKAGPASGNQSAIQILVDARPSDGAPIGVPLKRAAWQMAISSGALRLLDHEVGAALSEIYSYQDLMTDHHNRFVSGTLYTPAVFERNAGDAILRMLRAVLSEVAGNEEGLLEIYRKHLPLLRRAADG